MIAHDGVCRLDETDGERSLMRMMKYEHCEAEDHDWPFCSSNGIGTGPQGRTSSEIEWCDSHHTPSDCDPTATNLGRRRLPRERWVHAWVYMMQ